MATSNSSIINVPLHTLSNIIPLKLQDNNCFTCKALMKFHVEEIVTGESICPPKFLQPNTVNPAYIKWKDKDHTLLLLLHGSISASII